MDLHAPAKGAFLYNMLKRIRALALLILLLCSAVSPVSAVTLGPAASYEELAALLSTAANGDVILVSGQITALSSPPLSTQAVVHIQSDGSAVISALHLHDASIVFSGISFSDSLIISGNSHVQLGRHVFISGSPQSPALSFSGSGTLIIENGCSIEGRGGSPGVFISHQDGEFYSGIEGHIRGGDGLSGGPGLVISPLQNNGAVMITGVIEGGSGSGAGGHALNLYDLSGNAYVTIDGHIQGGSGLIGGNGIQIVSASDSVNVGVTGQAKGGPGKSHGGNALILMNARDASSFHVSGHFSGGDAIAENALPGTSLRLVGNAVVARTRVDNCILEDGKAFKATPAPSPAPSPAPASETSF